MLAFSRKQIISPVVLDLNHVIGETAKMLTRIIGEDIEFRVVSAESLWAIEADRLMLTTGDSTLDCLAWKAEIHFVCVDEATHPPASCS